MRLPTTSLRILPSLASILAALLVALASPGTAAAGEYTISICQAAKRAMSARPSKTSRPGG
jgi:hypothetical protein